MHRLTKRFRPGARFNNCLFLLLFSLLLNCQQLAIGKSIIDNHVEEYRVKAAFIYNFIAFTQWSEISGPTLDLCLYGEDNFGPEIDLLQTRPVNQLSIKVTRLSDLQHLQNCHVLFISRSEAESLTSILGQSQGKNILTIADSQSAASKGVIINMHLDENKVKFEINLKSARNAGLNINARLLQLATRVYQ
ncbi:YfiR family protein [Nitrosomonas sp.]|uniref:YfiR family protein n=1 Tax=Nitrosomonas sp. TaxID=42353 RepID=UPI001DFD240B|nr:YfiR family protein [Nitrosomonas sp.]MCB1947774.1 YfiR family protein [Nitrosomonas sp.]